MTMASHLSLFLLPEVESAKGHIPGKLFDYLGAGNPILGLGQWMAMQRGSFAMLRQERSSAMKYTRNR